MSSNAHSDASSPLKSLLLLLGVVAGLVVVDAGLLLATSTTGSELLRLALAGGAFAAPLLGFAVGIVHRPIYAVGAISRSRSWRYTPIRGCCCRGRSSPFRWVGSGSNYCSGFQW